MTPEYDMPCGKCGRLRPLSLHLATFCVNPSKVSMWWAVFLDMQGHMRVSCWQWGLRLPSIPPSALTFSAWMTLWLGTQSFKKNGISLSKFGKIDIGIPRKWMCTSNLRLEITLVPLLANEGRCHNPLKITLCLPGNLCSSWRRRSLCQEAQRASAERTGNLVRWAV